MSTQGNIIIMHSQQSMMEKGETSLCTGRAEFGAVLVDLQMNEKRRAHKEILLS